jgi:hypothetical protein
MATAESGGLSMDEITTMAARRPASGDKFECDQRYEQRLSSMIQQESHIIALNLLLGLLRPTLQSSLHDDAMIALAISRANFVEPLSKHEVIVLGCILYMEHLGRTTDYNDVLALTDRFRGQALNTTMVYRTFRQLVARGLIDERGRELDESTERLSRTFSINDYGKEAFRLAILNAHQLESFQKQAAA